MSFWAYMLQCRGGSLYIGQTDDLARRIARHQYGRIAGFTQEYLPVTLVWSQEFPSRLEAKAAERQIKGWSRAKKLALIRGDRVSQLARKKSSPSTSSGQTGGGGGVSLRIDGEGVGSGSGLGSAFVPEKEPECDARPARPELDEGLSLLTPHPARPPSAITAIRARITGIAENWLALRWTISGAGRIVLPPLAGKHRADDLWRRTCFEMFLQTPGSDAYVELNLSPSQAWGAYDFTGYRAGMTQRAMPRDPDCTLSGTGNTLIFDAAIPMAGLPPRPWRAGLTAVIEEEGGAVSYWSLAHPPGPPDFHHPACLALAVPAPAAP